MSLIPESVSRTTLLDVFVLDAVPIYGLAEVTLSYMTATPTVLAERQASSTLGDLAEVKEFSGSANWFGLKVWFTPSGEIKFTFTSTRLSPTSLIHFTMFDSNHIDNASATPHGMRR
ncbi:hypothetical protein FRC03_000888 [Tulasnella sp. 419]|nr:hypothetical protein FRC03_000888 [Tulasnella sp. 419]